MVKRKHEGLKVTNIEISYHRNGMCGAPFHVILFDHDGSRKVATFEQCNYEHSSS